MEESEDLVSDGRREIDQHFLTTDQIEVGNRWIRAQIVLAEGAYFANRRDNLIAPIDLHEEALQALGGYITRNALQVATGPGFRQGDLIDVSGKDLDGYLGDAAPKILEQADGDGVALFPGGTAWHPNSDRPVRRPVAHDRGKDLALEGL